MGKTYKATGINLKAKPLGEYDRLLTILTPEYGLITAIAPGARKHRSSLSGKSELFFVNQLLISKGRSLDKIIQVETIESYSGLSKNLGKLAAGQYLAELVLHQALSEQPQEQLFYLLREHLSRLERLSQEDLKLPNLLLAYLAHGIYHLLALDGIAPQVQMCCATGRPLRPNLTDPEWRIWFSIESGGTVVLSGLTENERSKTNPALKDLNTQIDAAQLKLLQDLALAELNQEIELTVSPNWVLVENLLRQYAQYQLGCSIRSAGLIDTYLEMTSFAQI
jgi:DNA repair protein RecO (recombination protein O)